MNKRRRYRTYFPIFASVLFLASCGEEKTDNSMEISAPSETVTVTVTQSKTAAPSESRTSQKPSVTDTTSDRSESTSKDLTDDSDLNAILEGREPLGMQDGREIIPDYREQYGSNPMLNTYTPTTERLIQRLNPNRYRLTPESSCEGLDEGFRTYGPNESVLVCTEDSGGRLVWDEEL